VTGEHLQTPLVQFWSAVQATDEVLTDTQVTFIDAILQTSPEAHAPVVHGIPSVCVPIAWQVEPFPNVF